jgi:transcriptional regulator with XRE-family HTH domain
MRHQQDAPKILGVVLVSSFCFCWGFSRYLLCSNSGSLQNAPFSAKQNLFKKNNNRMNKNPQSNNLHLLRLLNDDLPQKYVAHKIGISQVAYCKMEHGELTPSAATIQKLSELYNCNVAEVLYMNKEEIKKRLLGTAPEATYTYKENFKMKVDDATRKLRITVNNFKLFNW